MRPLYRTLVRLRMCLGRRASARRPSRAIPVVWTRTGPEGGTLLVQTGRRSMAQFNLDDSTILEIAAKLRASPGLQEVDLEVLHPMFRQSARVGPRVMPWLRCVLNVLAQEIEQKRRSCECAASVRRN